ncbi:beta2 tomatinase [Xylariales sp. PMI_506]|nr:beta2 tomatinase [Xylariales sp. PMI_506]
MLSSAQFVFGLFALQTIWLATVYGAETDWEVASLKADQFIAELTMTEKVSMVTGAELNGAVACIGNIVAIPRLNFSGLCLSDGPTAVNRADLVSIFPAGLTTAATWDKSLMYQRGLALGAEFRGKGVQVGMGPVAGPLGRHPLGGRNWEGFSPDPYLTGAAMNATIIGIQSNGVQACAKHYIGNEQETQRSNSISADGTNIEAISSNIGDRTLHELYLWPFADAVKAGTASVMCSYNRLNETYSCENAGILNNTLKTELGFPGYVMSDWFATHSGAASINAGLDMNMPGPIDAETEAAGATWSYFGANITVAIANGTVSEARLNDMIRRIMTQYFLLGQDSGYPTFDPSTTAVLAIGEGLPLSFLGINTAPAARDVRSDHATLIREIGAAGTVLLKNNETLPLQNVTNIAVFGNAAADLTEGFTFDNPLPPMGFDVGTLDVGGGSGGGRHTSLVTPLAAIQAYAGTIGARVQYITSNKKLSDGDFISIYPLPDVCLLFLKTFSQEGYDRLSFEADWNSTSVVESVANYCENTIVITQSAGLNTLPWASLTNVKAILATHLGGEQSGNSIVDVLWNKVNPSGKLPYTIPARESDYDIPIVNITDIDDPNGWQSNFTEGLLIDYRHFDSLNITPLYEFGYGLSYTTFDLVDDLQLSNVATNLTVAPNPTSPIIPGGIADLYSLVLTIKMSIQNTGSLAGSTVPQLYVSLPQDTTPPGTPIKVLRGFDKIYLEANETNAVYFDILRRDVSYWDTASQKWLIPQGQITFLAGFSSRDLPKTAQITLI